MRIELTFINSSLALLSFVYPEEAPVFSVVTNLATAFFALVILILSVAVTQVRRHEGIFTFVMLSLVIVSALHAAFSARLANKYAPVLLPIPTDEEVLAREEPSYSFGASLKRVAKGSWDFLHISLPLAILHIAIVLVFLLLTISMIIRVVDSSIEQPGQRWKVSPWVWSRKHFPGMSSRQRRSQPSCAKLISHRLQKLEEDSGKLEDASTLYTFLAAESASTILSLPLSPSQTARHP